MYNIDIDRSQRMVEVTLSGMLSVEETSAYIADLRHALVQQCMAQDFAMVIDVSGCPIQSQDMIGAMRDHMAAMPKARALAIVTGSSLARMQIRRLFQQSYARITVTRDEGRAWVCDGIEPAT